PHLTKIDDADAEEYRPKVQRIEAIGEERQPKSCKRSENPGRSRMMARDRNRPLVEEHALSKGSFAAPAIRMPGRRKEPWVEHEPYDEGCQDEPRIGANPYSAPDRQRQKR